MEDLKDIDIIVATRIDNHERAMNAFLMYRFFKDHTINSKFIFVVEVPFDRVASVKIFETTVRTR